MYEKVSKEATTTKAPASKWDCRRVCLGVFLESILFLGLLTFVMYRQPPEVRLTVDSYDGLPQNESNAVFSPEFNYTFYGKKGHGWMWISDKFCYSNGFIQIWYKGFNIASGLIEGSCLDATNDHTAMLSAWGQRIELPLQFKTRLRAEVEIGIAALQTKIQFDDNSPSISCRPLIGNKGYSQCSFEIRR